METPKTAEFAHIGKSVIIKGELSGSEDLYVDGQVEGTIALKGNSRLGGELEFERTLVALTRAA